MAGFRTFATGEVLTAANVNDFLMGQSVMRFADATARTAALGTDVVEGMLTYNLATDQLEVFDGTNFVVAAPEPPAGIGSNVVQTFFNTVFTTTSSSFVDVTGFTATITPTLNTSKILVLVQFAAVNQSASNDEFVLTRESTDIALANTKTYSGKQNYNNIGTANGFTIPAVINFLDSPATTSATTYKIRCLRDSAGTLRVGGSAADLLQVGSITLIEVAA